MTKKSERRLCLLCYNVRSLWNVGSFFRTADAFAVEKIYLTGYTGSPPRKEITKTAIGAETFVPWEHATDPLPVLKQLQEDGWSIVSLELSASSIDLRDFTTKEDKVCLVVGNELEGVPKDILAMSSGVVQIPMLGKKESLNVAVATGIALEHLRNA